MTNLPPADESEVPALDKRPKVYPVPWYRTTRMALAFIGCLGFVNLYAMRVNMSVAMVCMINQTALDLSTAASSFAMNKSILDGHANHSCGGRDSADSGKPKDGEFVWAKETQGFVLGAFFWGYLCTQLPGGMLAQLYGGRRVMGYSLLVASVATMLCAVGARISPYALIILRAIVGLGEGVVFVSMHDLWSRWAPPLERSKLIAFSQAGAQVGNVLALPISGLLCDYGFDSGWGSIFYVFGICGVLWCIPWLLLVSDSPAQHPRISQSERDYIEKSIGSRNKHLPLSQTPWLEFAKSKPVWAIVVGHACSNWTIYALLTSMPAYMKEVLKFDIKSNGLFSAIPYLVFWVFINVGGYIADFLRQRGWRTRDVRKIIFTLGSMSGLLLIATGYISCEHPYLAVAILSLATGFCGLQFPSLLVNHVDIAPPFAAVLLGISNTAGTVPGFVAPYAIKSLTPNSSQVEWRLVFYISAAIYIAGAIFYCLFADGDVQIWARKYMVSDTDQEVTDEQKKTAADDGLKDQETPLATIADDRKQNPQELLPNGSIG